MPSSIGPYAPPAGSGLSQFGLGPEWGQMYLNTLPEAGFWRYLQGMGLTGAGPESQFAQRSYGRQYGQYLGAAADNPNLGFYDYLQGSGYDPAQEYRNQSPQQRFDFTSSTFTPRARWAFK